MYKIPTRGGTPEPRKPGRPREDLESDVWDGVIRHKKRAGVTGFKAHGCKCPPCLEAAIKLRAKARASDRERRERGLQEGDFKHGVTGYRQYGCRCEICGPAGRDFNLSKRGPRSRPAKGPDDEQPEEPVVDWSEISHLRPGWTIEVRRGVA